MDSKVKVNTKETFFNMSFSTYNSNRRFEECSSLGKKPVLCKNSSKIATSRNIKVFFGGMGDIYKRPKSFRNYKEFKIHFLKRPTQERVSLTPLMDLDQAAVIQVEREYVEEGHTANRTSGKSTCGRLKILKPVHSILAFQSRRFVLPPQITAIGRLHVQAGHERCVFFSSAASVINELCSVFMVRESLRVSLIMCRLETRSQNLHKIAVNISACTEEDKYLDSNIFGQYAYDGSSDGTNSHFQRHCNLPNGTFRFWFKPGEVHF